MFLLFILVIGALGVIFFPLLVKHALEGLAGTAVIISAAFAIIAAASYSISLGTIADMEAFHRVNKFVYEGFAEKYPNSGKVITKGDLAEVITLQYDRVKLIAEYNKNLTWYRMYQNHWFIGGFVGKISPSLRYIVPPPLEDIRG